PGPGLAEGPLDREEGLGRRVPEDPQRRRPSTESNAIKPSSAYATLKRVFSANWGPISCSPTGRPSERPHGIEIPGSPAMFDGIVRTSVRYIASGSCVFAPTENAVVAHVGETRTS